jgi:hypothetical protein
VRHVEWWEVEGIIFFPVHHKLRDLIQNVGLDGDTIKFDIKHVSMWSVCICLAESGTQWRRISQPKSSKRARRAVLLHGVIFVGLEIKTSCYMSLVLALASVTVIRNPIRTLCLLM